MEVLWSLKQFGLTNGFAIPCLPAPCRKQDSQDFFCDRCWVARRCGGVTHCESLPERACCLSGINDVNCVAFYGYRRVRCAVPFVFGICRNDRRPLNTPPLAQVPIAHKHMSVRVSFPPYPDSTCKICCQPDSGTEKDTQRLHYRNRPLKVSRIGFRASCVMSVRLLIGAVACIINQRTPISRLHQM